MSVGFVIGASVLNVLLALAVSPLLEGLGRKLKATIHSRIGPPVIQPYYDLLKLLGKENLRSSRNPLVALMPYVTLVSVTTAALLVPMGTLFPPFDGFGDAIVFIYIITLAAVATILTAASSDNPFAFVGASREMMMHLTVEPVLVVALVTGALNAGSFRMGAIATWYFNHGPNASMLLATVFFFLALQAQVGKLPFDIAEADQEVMGGPYIEQSGPPYALLRWAMMAKQVVFCFVFAQVFLPWPMTGIWGVDLIIALVKVAVLVLVIALIDVVNPRLRVDQSVRYYLYLVVLSLSAPALYLAGI